MKLGYATGRSIPSKWPCNSDAEDNYNNNDKVKPKTSSFSSNIQA